MALIDILAFFEPPYGAFWHKGLSHRCVTFCINELLGNNLEVASNILLGFASRIKRPLGIF